MQRHFILTVLIFSGLASSHNFDYYIIRHGARAPLSKVDLTHIFGVESEQLTPPGRSQAFYLGQHLRWKFPQVHSNQFIIQSTNYPRTKETAEYFLKGWYNLSGESDFTYPATLMFEANPRFLPPIRIYNHPVPIFTKVHRRTNRHLIKMIPWITSHKDSRRPVQPPLGPVQLETVQYMKQNQANICQKADRFAPGACRDTSDIIGKFFTISDLLNCLEYQGQTILSLNQQEKNLVHKATDISYGLFRFRNPQVSQIINFFDLFKQYYNSNTRLVFEFNHDIILFGMIRALLGYQKFLQFFRPHIICPFLSVLRFRVRRGNVRMFFNDREVALTACFQNGDNLCRLRNFMDFKYIIPI